MRYDNSLLTRTRQKWKLRVATLGTLASTVALIATFCMQGVESPRHWYYFVLLGTLFATLFILPSYIRCPRCRTSWYWMATKTARHGWYKALATQSICPVCNYCGLLRPQ